MEKEETRNRQPNYEVMAIDDIGNVGGINQSIIGA